MEQTCKRTLQSGSTFKPLTAIAALETGNLNVNEIASLGSNVKPVIQNENCAVLMLNDATGEGVMTVYRVMPGVMICFFRHVHGTVRI